MIIGVDRSGDESSFPVVYVAVKCHDYRILDSLRQLVARRNPRKAMKSVLKASDLIDTELRFIENNTKGEAVYSVTTAKSYHKFRKDNPLIRKAEQKLAFENYLNILLPLAKDGDEIQLCRDFDEDSMKDILGRLRGRLPCGVIIRLSEKSEAVIVADLLAGAKRRNLRKK